MQHLLALFAKIPLSRMISMAGVTLFLLGFSIYMIERLNTPRLSPIFTELNGNDARGIIRQLESKGVKYEIADGGRTILAPQEQLFQLRLQLAEQGLPSQGSLGYEIFDKNDGFGLTSFVQNINHLRALEGELSRTISSLNMVRAARVHLVLPQKKLFQRDKAMPSASIVLKLNGRLNPNQVQAIRSLASSAVSGLKPEKISIVDEYGNLLTSAFDSDSGWNNARMTEHKNQLEQNLRNRLHKILANVVGAGNVQVELSARLNHIQSSESEEIFDPESQVIRSSQNREESNSSKEAGSDGNSVSVSSELPDSVGQDSATNTNQSKNQVVEETINYEISRKQREKVVQPGGIEKLTVAVLLNGTYTKGENGQDIYTPRSQEEIAKIRAIVISAVGIDEKRGDIIEVTGIKFNTPEIVFSDAASEDFLTLTRNDYMFIAEIAVLLVCVIIIVLLVVRPLLKRALNDTQILPQIQHQSNEAAQNEASNPQNVINQQAGNQPAIADARNSRQITDGRNVHNQIMEKFRGDMERTKGLIDIAKTSGEVQLDSIKQVSEMVEDNPEKALNVLREWMAETPPNAKLTS